MKSLVQDDGKSTAQKSVKEYGTVRLVTRPKSWLVTAPKSLKKLNDDTKSRQSGISSKAYSSVNNRC